jgi:hypothetical protein
MTLAEASISGVIAVMKEEECRKIVRQYLRSHSYTFSEAGGEGIDFTILSKRPVFQIECKRNQPESATGNGVADRALGQIIRYHNERPIRTYLVVPDDWKTVRNRGRKEGWYYQVARLLTELTLQDSVKVVTIQELREGSPF